MKTTEITPIAYIRTDFEEKFGIPRQSGRAPSTLARVIFLPKYASAEAFRELDGFSHVWLLFDFSLTRGKGWENTVRPPRLGGNKRVGVFASRSPFRPNHIGLSCVKLEKIEHTKEGETVLIVSGADLLDNTPIFDVKPYLPYTDCKKDALSGYAREVENHRLKVEIPPHLLAQIPEQKRQALQECLADDPRPSYQEDPTRVYGMRFAGLNVRFTVRENVVTVVAIDE